MTDPRRSEISAAETSSPPNGLYVLPNGEVAYIFEGHIIALGLDLPEGEFLSKVGEETDSLIAWKTPAELYGSFIAGLRKLEPESEGENHFLILRAGAPLDLDSSIWLEAYGPKSSSRYVRITADSGDEFFSVPSLTVDMPNIEKTITVYNDDKESHFLQIPDESAERREHARGKTTVTFEAGAVLSNTTVVSHGLGAVPVSIMATSYEAPAVNQIPLCNPYGATATQFSLNAEIDLAFAKKTSIPISWMADT